VYDAQYAPVDFLYPRFGHATKVTGRKRSKDPPYAADKFRVIGFFVSNLVRAVNRPPNRHGNRDGNIICWNKALNGFIRRIAGESCLRCQNSACSHQHQ